MLKQKKAAARKLQPAAEAQPRVPSRCPPVLLFCAQYAAYHWKASLAVACVLLLVYVLIGNSGGDEGVAASGLSATVSSSLFVGTAASSSSSGSSGSGSGSDGGVVAAALPPRPTPAASLAPPSNMCASWPFTSVGAPADPGRAGCAYGDRQQYVDAYTRTPGSEFSNSDDVVWAFANDIAQWGRSGAHGWDKHMASKGSTLVLVDVGANVGGFTKTLLATFGVPDGHNFAQIHAFEPYPVTYKTLAKELGLPHALSPVYLHNVALTDAPTVEKTGGRAEFFGAYLDINPNPTGASIGRTEEVQVPVGYVNLTTPDAFFDELEKVVGKGGLKGKEWILPFFKIDTEGQDLAVLRGMEGLLTRKNIQALTFEWGAKWALADPSYTLVEALKILDRHGYEAFHSGNHREGVFHWIPLSCQYWDDAYLRTLQKEHVRDAWVLFI